MGSRPGRYLSLVVCVLSLVAAGCGQPAAPAKPAEAAPTKGATAPTQGGPKAEAKPAAKAEPKSLPPLRAAYVAPIAAMAPLWMAKESGAFEREGVAVEVKSIQANAAISALFGGDVDLVEISAPAVVTAGIRDPDVVFIAGLLDKLIFSVWTRPEITSAQQLKGQQWASDRPGTPNEFATQVALDRLGLKRSDLQVLPIGSSDRVLAALLSGQVAAAPLTPPADFTAEKNGYRRLIDRYAFPQATGVG